MTQLNLFAELVKGRNLRTVSTVQTMLPYALLEAAITDHALNAGHEKVRRQAPTAGRCCYCWWRSWW